MRSELLRRHGVSVIEPCWLTCFFIRYSFVLLSVLFCVAIFSCDAYWIGICSFLGKRNVFGRTLCVIVFWFAVLLISQCLLYTSIVYFSQCICVTPTCAESYYDAADKALSGGGSSEADTNRARRRGASDANTTSIDDLLDDCRDVWAEEMRYRMAVAFLSSCWEKASAELSRLFTTMKETECSRRFRLRELLISSLQRKERLYLSLPSVLTPVLKDLVNRPMDTLSIEDDVQTSIRVRAQAIQREELTEKKRVEPGSGLLGVKTKDGQFELSSPLLSDLLCKAKVIEKKSSGMIAGWRTTLAIITADSFLHLFEIPNSFKVQSGTAPEVAFHALVPPVEVPSESAIKEGKYDKQLSKAGLGDGAAATGQLMIKIWNARLTPTISIVLANSTVAFQNRPGNSTFEITETYGAHGASKLFGKLSTRKYHFRALTTEDAIEWTTILKSQK